MSAVMREHDRLGQMLVEWAEFKRAEVSAGFKPTDSIARMKEGKGGPPEYLPIGLAKLWANPEVRRVEQAVNALRGEHKRLMQFVQAFYIAGPGPLASLGWTHKTMNDNIAAAHKLIRHEMRLRG